MFLSQLPGGAPGREPVPFSFVAEADAFRSNVAPPPREPVSAKQMAGHTLLGLTIVAGLVGSLLVGTPALSPEQAPKSTEHTQASEGR